MLLNVEWCILSVESTWKGVLETKVLCLRVLELSKDPLSCQVERSSLSVRLQWYHLYFHSKCSSCRNPFLQKETCGFPQYLVPLQVMNRLSDTSLYPTVTSPSCIWQCYWLLLVLVKGECLWIVWCRHLEGPISLQNQANPKLSTDFIACCILILQPLEMERGACLVSCGSFVRCHEFGYVSDVPL